MKTNSNGSTALVQRQYANDTDYNDEFGKVDLFGSELALFGLEDHYTTDRSVPLHNASVFWDPYYEDVSCYYNMNTTEVVALSLLENSKAFVFRGHAGPSCLQISSYLCDSDYNLLSVHELADADLSSLDLVVLLGCSTNVLENGTSIAQVMADKGARVVIGSVDTINAPEANLWLDTFAFSLSKGDTMQQALFHANRIAGSACEMSIIGNGNLTFSSLMN